MAGMVVPKHLVISGCKDSMAALSQQLLTRLTLWMMPRRGRVGDGRHRWCTGAAVAVIEPFAQMGTTLRHQDAFQSAA